MGNNYKTIVYLTTNIKNNKIYVESFGIDMDVVFNDDICIYYNGEVANKADIEAKRAVLHQPPSPQLLAIPYITPQYSPEEHKSFLASGAFREGT